MHPAPAVSIARVLLRVEYEDGQIREFEAPKPYDLECTVKYPLEPYPLSGPAVPYLIGAGEAVSVQMGFKASSDPRYPMVARTEAARSPQARLAEVRGFAERLSEEDHPHGMALLGILDQP
jgi:hypothetical protein